MAHEQNDIDRRGFLKTGIGVAAAASALGAGTSHAQAAGTKTITSDLNIPVRKFGKTGYSFPVLGHGGSAMMEKEYQYYGLDDPPSFDDRVKMVRDAFDKGIRYFDNARIYQESEQVMGEALHDVADQLYLASKVLVGEPGQVRPSVEQSLETLKIDRIDCIQIHGPSIERLKYEGAMQLYEELVKLRDEGLIQFIGLTGHNAFEEMYKMIDTGGFDQVLIEFGYFRKGYNTRHSDTTMEWREACVARAHELDMGIVAMKVLGAWIFNHNAPKVVPDYDPEAITKLPTACFRWVMRDERISVLNIGVSYPGDVDRNIAILQGDLAYTNEDRLLLADFSARAYQTERVQEFPVV
jgi:predicted aldo/keto reductase-like oxidoreductase